MEQNIQRNIENKLPTKTKIAAICLSVIDLILIILSSSFTNQFTEDVFGFLDAGVHHIFGFISIFPASVISFTASIFILFKKKVAWWFSIIFNALILLFLLMSHFHKIYLFTVGILILIAIILLLLDRKNFWKVAR